LGLQQAFPECTERVESRWLSEVAFILPDWAHRSPNFAVRGAACLLLPLYIWPRDTVRKEGKPSKE